MTPTFYRDITCVFIIWPMLYGYIYMACVIHTWPVLYLHELCYSYVTCVIFI